MQQPLAFLKTQGSGDILTLIRIDVHRFGDNLSAKIGRNERCPCGSGKKYKMCHGALAAVFSSLNRTTKVQTQASNVPTGYLKTRRELLVERRTLFGEANVTPELMLEYGLSLQSRMAEVLKDYSPVFWLVLLRRRPIQLAHSPHLQLLIRWQLSSLFWLYGDQAKEDYSISASGELLLSKEPKAVAALDEVLAFANEIVNVPSAFRRLSRGASFRLGLDGSLVTTLPKHLEDAARFYDRRRSENGNPLDEKGLSIPTPKTRGTWSVGLGFRADGSLVVDSSKVMIRFYEENTIGDIEYATGGFDGFEEPAFIRSAWDVSGWSAYVKCFGPELEAKWGLSVEEYLAGFKALSTLVQKNYSGQRGVTCHQLGLLALPYEEFKEHFLCSLLKLCDTTRVSDLLASFCRLLEHDADSLLEYDFFSIHSAGVLLRSDQTVLLDVSQIGHKLEQSLTQLAIDSEMQFEKGVAFERVVSDALRKRLNGVTYPIGDSQELFLEGSGTPFAEADVYVSKGDTLFLIDCKACGVSRGYLKGLTRPVQSRWIKVRRWLAESDARALKIANAPKGRNYALESHLKWIVPIVCSSMSEYFWESDNDLRLTDTIPRVCTIGELLEVLENAESIIWQDKSYRVPISQQ